MIKGLITGVSSAHAKPCPVCGSPMECYDTAAFSDASLAQAYYLVACSHCGHGPTTAFVSSNEAIQHWNNSVDNMISCNAA
jgi:transcription elongation factor Elf1